MGRRPGFVPVAAGLLAVTLLYSAPARAQEDGGGQRYEWEGGRAPSSAPAGCPCVGPPRGTILIAGGGDLSLGIYQSFVKLAGGRNARIVVIPTAEDGDHFPTAWVGLEPFLQAGARSVRVLHTRSPDRANEEDFVAPLTTATGVWIMGGRQWRLTQAYLGTRTQEELRGVLERGGVVGGTSAGASVLASYLVRGHPNGSESVTEPGYDVGFGLLQGVAVDQHLIARRREGDLVRITQAYPHLLGIGLDEGTALVIQGDIARVEGVSLVGVYDRLGRSYPLPFRWLVPGDSYDLGQRQRIRQRANEPVILPSSF